MQKSILLGNNIKCVIIEIKHKINFQANMKL